MKYELHPCQREIDGTSHAIVRQENGGCDVAYVHPSEPASVFAASADTLAALKRAVPWLGKLIADGGHQNSVLPQDAVGALAQAEAAIRKADKPMP